MARRPREFRYWENIEQLKWKAPRRVLERLLGVDPVLPDDVVETLGEMYFEADPLAEAFVQEVYFGGGRGKGRAMLDQALEEGVASVSDAPPTLHALFADLEQDPEWVDFDLVEHGAKVFRRYGSDVFAFAGAITLTSYAENSVTKPLVLTGAYAGDTAKKRFLETASFWIDVSEPGGMRPGAQGRATAMKVRIMHVFVREHLKKHAEWDEDAWGTPISQGDALLTLMGGSVAPGLAMRAMGYRPSRRDIEAMMHFWRYVGHVMGVRPRWFPESITQALQLLFVTLVKGSHEAGQDGQDLCQSFAHAFEPSGEGSLEERVVDFYYDRLHRGATRFFTAPWTHREMKMPPAGVWALHPLLQLPFIFAAETLRRRFPSLESVADDVARARRRRWLAHHSRSTSAAYCPVDGFTR